MEDAVEEIKQHDFLSEYGRFDYYITKEPGGSGTRDAIEDIIRADNNLCKPSELLLFMADRAQHINNISRLLQEGDGNIVFTDRFWESTLVYQGLVQNILDPEKLIEIHEELIGVKPDYGLMVNSAVNHNLTPDCKEEEDCMGSLTLDKRVEFVNAYEQIARLVEYHVDRIDTTDGDWEFHREEMVKYLTTFIKLEMGVYDF